MASGRVPDRAWKTLQVMQWMLVVMAPGIGFALLSPDNGMGAAYIAAHGVPFVVTAGLARWVSKSRANLWALTGATGAAATSSAFLWLWAGWDVYHSWPGGADIGLGIALLGYPLVVGPIMISAFIVGRIAAGLFGGGPHPAMEP